MKQKPKSDVFTVRLPPELMERVEKLSSATGLTQSWIATRCVDRYLAEIEKMFAEKEEPPKPNSNSEGKGDVELKVKQTIGRVQAAARKAVDLRPRL